MITLIVVTNWYNGTDPSMKENPFCIASLGNRPRTTFYPPATLTPMKKSHEIHQSKTPETPQPTHNKTRPDAGKGYAEKATKRIITSFYTVLLFKTFQILLPFRHILFLNLVFQFLLKLNFAALNGFFDM